jgi:hypothetical protein
MRPNSPVPLTRTTEPLYNAGNPYVLLSPSGNARNIRTIYEVIRGEKNSQALHADYTVRGEPWVGFANKNPKYDEDPVAVANMRKQRKELVEILLRTTETIEKKFKYLTRDQRDANRALKIFAITAPLDRDIKVGDIKPHLKVLNRAYTDSTTKAWQEKEIEPYRDHSDAQKMKRQRARQFLNMEPSTRLMLVNTLTRSEDRGPDRAIAGIRAMEDFLRNFLNPKESYREMVRKVTDNADLQFFCHRWLSAHPLSGKKGTVYQASAKFAPYPWSRLLDTLCRLIIKEVRRQTIIVSDDDAKGRKMSIVFRRSSLANLQHIKPDIPASSKIDLSLFPFMQKEPVSQTKSDHSDQASTISEKKSKPTAKPEATSNAKSNANVDVKSDLNIDVEVGEKSGKTSHDKTLVTPDVKSDRQLNENQKLETGVKVDVKKLSD